MLTSKELLVYLSIIYDNDFDRIYNHIRNKDSLDKEDLRRVLKQVNLDDYIVMTDGDYPAELKKINRPPFAVKREDVDVLVDVIRRLKNENEKKTVNKDQHFAQ